MKKSGETRGGEEDHTPVLSAWHIAHNTYPVAILSSRCVIYRLVKILGNKISLEDLRAKVVIAERALAKGKTRDAADFVYTCTNTRPLTPLRGANIVNKSRILYASCCFWTRTRASGAPSPPMVENNFETIFLLKFFSFKNDFNGQKYAIDFREK